VWTVTDCSNIVAAESYVSTVSMALTVGCARLPARQSEFRIPVGKDFLSRQYAQTGSGVHPPPYFTGTGVLFLGYCGQDARLITNLLLVSKLRMNGAISPPPHMPSWLWHGQLLLRYFHQPLAFTSYIPTISFNLIFPDPYPLLNGCFPQGFTLKFGMCFSCPHSVHIISI
jgi:hypothetical protein